MHVLVDEEIKTPMKKYEDVTIGDYDLILDLILQAVIANKNFKLCSMCVYIVNIFSSCNRFKKKINCPFLFPD